MEHIVCYQYAEYYKGTRLPGYYVSIDTPSFLKMYGVFDYEIVCVWKIKLKEKP